MLNSSVWSLADKVQMVGEEVRGQTGAPWIGPCKEFGVDSEGGGVEGRTDML